MYSLVLHGRRLCELQKWRHFTVSTKLFQNVSAFSDSFSSVTAAADVSLGDGRKRNSFTVSYLVGSLGLSTKLAESISRKVSFVEKGNPESVLNLFKSHGFTNSQISSIITDYPGLLILDAEKSLGPKLQFLQSRGASTSELTEILSTVPKILGMRGDKTISRYYDFVKAILKDEEQEAGSMISPQGKQENKFRNVSALRGLGVPRSSLFTLLNSHIVQPIYGKEKLEESVKKVVEMGFDPTTPRFVEALRVIYKCKNETIEEKVNVCKRLGFSVDDVWEMFKKHPMFLAFSEKKIRQAFEILKKCGILENEILSVLKKYPQCIGASEQNVLSSIETSLGLGFSRDEFAMMVKRFPLCIKYSAESVKKKTEFVVKKMGWPLKAVVLYPQVIGYSMEKRIVPRCNVIKALISKGLLGNELPSMTSVLVCSDQLFLDRFVMMHGVLVPELMAIFTMKEEKNR